jgi:hypothetical protein
MMGGNRTTANNFVVTKGESIRAKIKTIRIVESLALVNLMKNFYWISFHTVKCHLSPVVLDVNFVIIDQLAGTVDGHVIN